MKLPWPGEDWKSIRHYPHYYATTAPVSAIRAGDWKLLEYFADNHVELYGLKDDPGESRDLAAAQADTPRASSAGSMPGASRWTRLPVANPDFAARPLKAPNQGG